MEYFSAFKKKILPLKRTQMDLKGIMLKAVSYLEKDKYCVI